MRSGSITVVEDEPESLTEYATVPIAYEVTSVLLVEPSADQRGFRTTEARVPAPFVKDYDAVPGNSPLRWPSRFDVSGWGFFAAYVAGQRVGGAVVIAREPGVELLEGRDDRALLWDLRVAPAYRGTGVGTALLSAVQRWATERGAATLEAETQNINVPACRFYARQGFTLRAVNERAYPDLPGEIQLLWHKSL